MSAARLVADALVLAGIAVLTLAVWGLLRLPDTFARLHAASKAAALGVALLLSSSLTTGQPAMVVRALVVLVFLCITTPVGSHAIARLEQALREGRVPGQPEPPVRWPAAVRGRKRKSPRGSAGSLGAVRRDARTLEEKRGDERRSKPGAEGD